MEVQLNQIDQFIVILMVASDVQTSIQDYDARISHGIWRPINMSRRINVGPDEKYAFTSIRNTYQLYIYLCKTIWSHFMRSPLLKDNQVHGKMPWEKKGRKDQYTMKIINQNSKIGRKGFYSQVNDLTSKYNNDFLSYGNQGQFTQASNFLTKLAISIEIPLESFFGEILAHLESNQNLELTF